jgi:DNA polymerase-3 subunit delta
MPETPHITFLYGNDEYAIAQRVREFASAFADQFQAEMNTTHLDAETMTEDQWSNAVNALPFLAPQRLVLLANPSRRFAGTRSEEDRADSVKSAARSQARIGFLESLSKIPVSTRLVMWEHVDVQSWGSPAEQQKKDEKHWLVKWMKENALGLERHALPMAAEMPGWIVKYAKAQGGQMAGAAAARLAEMVGTDTRQAVQETTKLLTYVNWSRPVTAADVEALSPLTAEPDVFAMVDALAAGKTGRAQRLLHRLFEAQDAFSTWGMIVRQFRLLLLAREVLDQRGGEPEAVKALGVTRFVARKALGQARGFTMPRLEAIYHRLLEIDEAAKTGRMPLDLGIDILFAELADLRS